MSEANSEVLQRGLIERHSLSVSIEKPECTDLYSETVLKVEVFSEGEPSTAFLTWLCTELARVVSESFRSFREEFWHHPDLKVATGMQRKVGGIHKDGLSA